jgi:hypothetical protein
MAAEIVVSALRQAWQVLTGLQIPSALMGGMALAYWGHVRSTQDVDLLIALTDMRPQKLLSSLATAGYRSKGASPFVRVGDLEFVQLVYQPPGALMDVQLDLLLADSPFHRQAIKRRIPLSESDLGFAVDVVSCEDLILLKLVSGRILDHADAAELLKVNHAKLDMGYLTPWVTQLGLQEPFRGAWKEGVPATQPPMEP